MKLGTPNMTRREMGDPAVAYERDEACTCYGCIHEDWLLICGELIPGCRKGRKHGRKCPQFRVRSAVTRTDGDG